MIYDDYDLISPCLRFSAANKRDFHRLPSVLSLQISTECCSKSLWWYLSVNMDKQLQCNFVVLSCCKMQWHVYKMHAFICRCQEVTKGSTRTLFYWNLRQQICVFTRLSRQIFFSAPMCFAEISSDMSQRGPSIRFLCNWQRYRFNLSMFPSVS